MPFSPDPPIPDSSRAVALMRRDQADAMVRASEANGGHMWGDEAVDAAWELTHGHPYLLQYLCWHVGERTRGKLAPRRPSATRADVEAAVPATLADTRKTLERMWEDVPPAMRAVVWALARTGPKALPEERLRQMLAARGMLDEPRDLVKALRSTEGWDLLEAVDGAYRLRMDLLRRWIVRLAPPEGALDLLQSVLDRESKHETERLVVDALGKGRLPAMTLPMDEHGPPSKAVPASVGTVAAKSNSRPPAATLPLDEHGPLSKAVPAPVGTVEPGANDEGRAAAAKPRPRRSVVPWIAAAAIGVVVGWLARGGVGSPSPQPAAVVPTSTGSVLPPPAASTVDPAASAVDDDGQSLPPGRGYLVVDAPVESGVFTFGRFVGLSGRKLEVRCGSKFVRLGVPPADENTPPDRIVWTSRGKHVQVACQAVTHVSLVPTQ